MQENPYQAPSSVVFVEAAADDANVALRQAHIRHEIQLQSIGALYLLGSILIGIVAIPMVFDIGEIRGGFSGMWLGILTIYGFLAAVLFALGIGFRRLHSWVRIPGAIFSGIGLLGFPIGTLISAWILYLMFCRAGRVVLAPTYRAVIDATPQVRYRRTKGDWIATGLVIAVSVFLVGAVAMSVLG